MGKKSIDSKTKGSRTATPDSSATAARTTASRPATVATARPAKKSKCCACCGGKNSGLGSSQQGSWAESRAQSFTTGSLSSNSLFDANNDSPRGVPAVYADVNDDKSDGELDYKKFNIDWEEKERFAFELIPRNVVGEGSYGKVYLAHDNKSGKQVVVKTMKPEKWEEDKMKKEIFMLKLVKKGPFIVKLLGCIYDEPIRTRMLVFEYVNSPPYKDAMKNLKEDELRTYFYKVLKALEYTHSQGLIHRDVKPGNVLFDPNTGDVRLIDWGFCEFYQKDGFELWPGTRTYKAPELFLHYPYYDYQCDMWSFGVMMAVIVFKNHLFVGDDDIWHMQRIIDVLGLDDYRRFLAKYSHKNKTKYQLDPKFVARFKVATNTPRERTNMMSFAVRGQPPPSEEFINLLNKCLTYDHERRITASAALKHKFFKTENPDAYSESASNNSAQSATTHSHYSYGTHNETTHEETVDELSEDQEEPSESEAGSSRSRSRRTGTGRRRAALVGRSDTGSDPRSAVRSVSRSVSPVVVGSSSGSA